jgi:PTH1 family peptidyl-tRNA hydrolase
MKLVIGLGNPGPEYAQTRHNAGFWVVDALAERFGGAGGGGGAWRSRFKALTMDAALPEAFDRTGGLTERVLLMKPTTYMNLSGQSVAEAVRFFKLDPGEDLLVVVDEIALPAGSFKLKAKGGAGGHNGLKSIEQLLGTQAYPRLRVGIDPPGRIPQVDYVLGKFTEDQRPLVDKAVLEAAAAVCTWAHEGIVAAQNKHHAPEPKPEPKPKDKSKPTSKETPNTDAAASGDAAAKSAGDADTPAAPGGSEDEALRQAWEGFRPGG